MGDVVSFEAWQKDSRYLVMNSPCNERPFHVEDYVYAFDGEEAKCLRCNVNVEQATHPSFEGIRWYG